MSKAQEEKREALRRVVAETIEEISNSPKVKNSTNSLELELCNYFKKYFLWINTKFNFVYSLKFQNGDKHQTQQGLGK